jgi:menaquinone-9 beta-reductase
MSDRVLIIGGGPAGSAAAFHLALAGAQVTVVEARAFPRMKVCGEYISPAARDLLEELVDAPSLTAHGARLVDSFVLQQGDTHCSWPTPQAGWSLSRAVLDELLLQRAREAGAEVRQPLAVREIRYKSDAVTALLSDGTELRAAIVIHADGSGRHDPSGPVPLARNLTGHKCHIRLPPQLRAVRTTGASRGVAVSLRACPAAYVGTLQVENDRFTCALVARRSVVARFGADADAMLSHLWPQYTRSWRVSDWKSCGVARSSYIRPGHPRSFRIGNAAAAVDPVGGEGIGLALWSGKLAAETLMRECRGGIDGACLSRTERTLAAAYRERLRTRLPACRVVAELLLRPQLLRPLWPLLRIPALSLQPWYLLTGKPA